MSDQANKIPVVETKPPVTAPEKGNVAPADAAKTPVPADEPAKVL